MNITIVRVDKKKTAFSSLVAEYVMRMDRLGGCEEVVLPPAGVPDEDFARRRESASVASKLRDDDLVILCDERGQGLSSVALAAKLEQFESSGRRIVCIIGGAYGVDAEVLPRVDLTLRLSDFVMPHGLAAVVLAEQLYRAQMINAGHPYHHV